MMQTWPTHDAYRAQIDFERGREREVEKYQQTFCRHDRTMRQECAPCGRLDRPATALEYMEFERLPNQILQSVGMGLKFVWPPGHDMQVLEGDRTVCWLSGKERVHVPSQMYLVIAGWLAQTREDQAR
jgi:hypothetical protein